MRIPCRYAFDALTVIRIALYFKCTMCGAVPLYRLLRTDHCSLMSDDALAQHSPALITDDDSVSFVFLRRYSTD